jgi:CheY-like chemotaxis protein
VALALKKAFSQPDIAAGGEASLPLAEKQAYDVIFLDVEMAGMDGYELCTKIHETALNRSTPVIFVTRHSDFDSRAKSTRSGAQDLIGKPFLAFEITVKALTFVLRERLKPKAQMAEKGSADASSKEISTEMLQAASGDFAKSFFACAPAHLDLVREQLRGLSQGRTEAAQEESLGNFYVSMQSFAGEAERAELRAIAALSSGVLAMIKKVIERPDLLANSNVEAATGALDLLEELCADSLNPSLSDPDVRTLIVDDDPIALRAISVAVQAAFSKSQTASTGEEAALRAAAEGFDLILLDVEMPGLDGFKTARRIRENGPNRTTPVIFITGFDDHESREKAVALGCRGFIAKPAIPAEITLRALTFALRARLDKLRREDRATTASQTSSGPAQDSHATTPTLMAGAALP